MSQQSGHSKLCAGFGKTICQSLFDFWYQLNGVRIGEDIIYFWPQNIPENLIWLGNVKYELKFISQTLFGLVSTASVPDKQGRVGEFYDKHHKVDILKMYAQPKFWLYLPLQ